MRVCQNCGKKAVSGNLISHSHHKEKRLFRPNLHAVTFVVSGVKRRMLLCSRCLKTIKMQNLKIKAPVQVVLEALAVS